MRDICPECPLVKELVAKRIRLTRELLLSQDSMSKTRRNEIWKKAAWDDEDIRELARTCWKHPFSRYGELRCTSLPEQNNAD